jgi:hypothetical protein
MRQHYYSYSFFLGILCILFSCAQPIPPSGGPKDETPPVLVEEESTPNYQTSFQKNDIKLTFDEWIKLSDVFTQVVISPPLKTNPQITLKNKSVLVQFDEEEVLRDNTTYTINFGSAIADITESNVLENFKFVFSTGLFLDSLSIGGTVVNAATKAPEKDVLVMLYDMLGDSIVYKERPAYFSKTDKDGAYRIENIREDTFKVFALKDINLNYLYDQESELVGFADSTIYLDTAYAAEVSLPVFSRRLRVNITERNNSDPGILKLALSSVPDISDLYYENVDQNIFWIQDRDTLRIWYTTNDTSSLQIFPAFNGYEPDTVVLTPVIRTEENAKLRIEGGNAPQYFRQNPMTFLQMKSDIPLDLIDTSNIRITREDTIKVRVDTFNIDSLDRRLASLGLNWEEKSNYQIYLDPGALTDIYGFMNDSITLKRSTAELKNYGNIEVRISSLNPNFNYLLQLLQGDEMIYQQLIEKQRGTQYTINNLSPRIYQIKLIEDANGNGIWDTGDYEAKTQPESLLIKELETLRAGWDMSVSITWNR